MKHLVDEKEIEEGASVKYTDAAGVAHRAVLKSLPVVYRGAVEAHIDGSTKFFDDVPFSKEGGAHTWSHMTEDEEQESEDQPRSLSGSEPAPVSIQSDSVEQRETPGQEADDALAGNNTVPSDAPLY